MQNFSAIMQNLLTSTTYANSTCWLPIARPPHPYKNSSSTWSGAGNPALSSYHDVQFLQQFSNVIDISFGLSYRRRLCQIASPQPFASHNRMHIPYPLAIHRLTQTLFSCISKPLIASKKFTKISIKSNNMLDIVEQSIKLSPCSMNREQTVPSDL